VPIRILLSAGNIHDVKLAGELIENLSVKTVLADRGYDSDDFRNTIENPCIPGCKNRKVEIKYDKEIYKKRNVVERFFMKIKRFRRISTRYEQTASSFLSMVKLVSSIVIMRWY
jgi:transposase